MEEERVDAAIALLKLSTSHINVSVPLMNITATDFGAKRFIARDRRRIQSITKDGKLQEVNWNARATRFPRIQDIQQLEKVLHRIAIEAPTEREESYIAAPETTKTMKLLSAEI